MKRRELDINKLQRANLKKYFINVSEELKSESDVKNGKKGYHQFECERIDFFSESTALAAYLSGTNTELKLDNELIFPFGLNNSQLNAVEMAFKNQISVIQGPPGTGKTQTILSLIANTIMANKTIAVVSPNNAATDNIYEKLEKYGFEFIAANLGNTTKTNKFFKNIPEIPKEIESWELSKEKIAKCNQKLQNKLLILRKIFDVENKLAKLEQELREWQQEEKYFEEYLASNKELPNQLKLPMRKLTNKKQMNLLVDLNYQLNETLWFGKKLQYFIRYGLYDFSVISSRESIQLTVDKLEKQYYYSKIRLMKNEIDKEKQFLKKNKAEKLKEEVSLLSQLLFKSHLFLKYKNIRNRATENTFKKKYKEFSEDFPLTLSTCDSITRNIKGKAKFDYVVIDEASMGSLVPSIFPLSVAKNVVIVGDSKQLANIVTHRKEKEKKIMKIDNPAYDYLKQSILSSVENIYGNNLPSTLLKEHYRCHPMIINFCNKEFYNDELVVLSNYKEGEKPLMLLETSEGNHMKFDYDYKIFNQREIDSFFSDDFKNNCSSILRMQKIGFVTPFRRQVEKTNTTIKKYGLNYLTDTIHKFQGRECEAIIFSTVLDNKGSKRNYDFVEQNELVNVAVSRAERLFILNCSVDKFSERNGSIASLIRYIKYYSDYSLEHKSNVNSIFDLLTKDFQQQLEKRKKSYIRNHSRYDSENLMMDLIHNVLKEEKYKSLTCTTEYIVKKLVNSFEILDEDEYKYVMNGARLDFVFYYKTGNEPIAAIEVDGHKYHSKPEQLIKDNRKDSILKKLNIKLKRFSTNGSEEEKNLRDFLDELI